MTDFDVELNEIRAKHERTRKVLEAKLEKVRVMQEIIDDYTVRIEEHRKVAENRQAKYNEEKRLIGKLEEKLPEMNEEYWKESNAGMHLEYESEILKTFAIGEKDSDRVAERKRQRQEQYKLEDKTGYWVKDYKVDPMKKLSWDGLKTEFNKVNLGLRKVGHGK